MKVDCEKIYDAMSAKGIFIKDLCSKVNMNERTLKRIMSDSGEIDAGTVLKISRVLGVKLHDLEKTK